MKRYQYKVSACLLIKDENRYLPEWLEWHASTGVEHFYIYDNGSKVPIRDAVPGAFAGMCTVVDFPPPRGHTQIDCYADALARFGGETEWMAFIDTDEFIRVVDGTPLPQFLERYGQADALAVRWLVYNADGQLHDDGRPVRSRFHTVVEYPADMPQCKCIMRTARCRMMAPHHPINTNGDKLTVVNEDGEAHWPVTAPLPHEKIVIDHYFTRSWDEWREKMGRGSCDPTYRREDDWFHRLNPGLVGPAGPQADENSGGGGASPPKGGIEHGDLRA